MVAPDVLYRAGQIQQSGSKLAIGHLSDPCLKQSAYFLNPLPMPFAFAPANTDSDLSDREFHSRMVLIYGHLN